jgi:hypothetical protein
MIYTWLKRASVSVNLQSEELYQWVQNCKKHVYLINTTILNVINNLF